MRMKIKELKEILAMHNSRYDEMDICVTDGERVINITDHVYIEGNNTFLLIVSDGTKCGWAKRNEER